MNGVQVPNVTLFPSSAGGKGMKPLADWLHQRGFKLGLYSDAGTATCQKRAGSLGHEEKDATTYAA